MKNSPLPSEKDGPYPDSAIQQDTAAPFTASDIPIDDEGRIYHLQIKPGQIARDILLVGDPGRAEYIGSRFLREIECEHDNRGLVTVTGTAEISGEPATIISPTSTTVTTSGIGPPSLEIVVNELVILNEIDFETRRRKTHYPRLNVIRIGTSGGLQAPTRLGTPIITTYAIGLDNAGVFYDVPYPNEVCERLEGDLREALNVNLSPKSRFFGKIHPYVARANPAIVGALLEAAQSLDVEVKAGLTVSAPGFFAPQGRDISRLKPTIPDLDQLFSEFDPQVDGQCIENMEMEASFLLHFLGGLGYWAGAICPAIANRREDTFDVHYQEAVDNAVRIALLAIAKIRNRYPDP